MDELSFSPACERNKSPILAILRDALADCGSVLEIGSGTGQHAVHFASGLPQLTWQPTDLGENLAALIARIDAEGTRNCAQPLELDVHSPEWPVKSVEAVFSANTLHIMSWVGVRAFFAGVGRVLAVGGRLCIYGPFRYDGDYTSPSNAAFDWSLRDRDPASGIRDFEAVAELATQQQLTSLADHAMPANNQLLVWERNA